MPPLLLLLIGVPLTFVFLLVLIRALLGRISVSRLDQRAVLITGCDSGFGFELALRCLRARMRVFAACLTEQGAESLRKTALEQGLITEKLESFEMDVRSDQSVAKALEFVREKLGLGKGLHALVNNAGISGNTCWDDWLVPEDYEEVWQGCTLCYMNTLGPIRVTQTFKQMIKRERGSRIVMMSSCCGRIALPATGPYNTSKFALEGYSDTVRTEMILFGVKVSIVEPGFFRTSMTDSKRTCALIDKMWSRLPERVKQDYGEGFLEFTKRYTADFLHPKRLSSPELVVNAYWHAISSAWPRRRYKVGMDMNCWWGPLAVMPAELQDVFFTCLQLVKGVPTPISALRPKTA